MRSRRGWPLGPGPRKSGVPGEGAMRARATRVLHLQRLPRPRGGPLLRRGCPRGLALPCPPAGPEARAVEEGRGGARTSPARPLAQPPGCPHFLPLPASSGRPHALPAAPSSIDPLSPPWLPLRPGQDNRGHRAFAYRVSLTGKKWVPEGRDRAPTAWHPHEGHSRAPCPGRPQGSAIARLPGAALGLFSI